MLTAVPLVIGIARAEANLGQLGIGALQSAYLLSMLFALLVSVLDRLVGVRIALCLQGIPSHFQWLCKV